MPRDSEPRPHRLDRRNSGRRHGDAVREREPAQRGARADGVYALVGDGAEAHLAYSSMA